jgi:hypothetical protein
LTGKHCARAGGIAPSASAQAHIELCWNTTWTSAVMIAMHDAEPCTERAQMQTQKPTQALSKQSDSAALKDCRGPAACMLGRVLTGWGLGSTAEDGSHAAHEG